MRIRYQCQEMFILTAILAIRVWPRSLAASLAWGLGEAICARVVWRAIWAPDNVPHPDGPDLSSHHPDEGFPHQPQRPRPVTINQHATVSGPPAWAYRPQRAVHTSTPNQSGETGALDTHQHHYFSFRPKQERVVGEMSINGHRRLLLSADLSAIFTVIRETLHCSQKMPIAQPKRAFHRGKCQPAPSLYMRCSWMRPALATDSAKPTLAAQRE